MQEHALAVLQSADGVAIVASIDSATSTLTATFDAGWLEAHGRAQMNSVVRALTDANVLVLAFELEGGRLSDAFLSLTEEGNR
jgi:hypothetical protein